MLLVLIAASASAAFDVFAKGDVAPDPPPPEGTDGEDPRGEIRTFASFPEWYIVYSGQEYADFVTEGGRPSAFPYFGAIGQYWRSVTLSKKAAGSEAKIDPTTQTVLKFIGVSFSLEYGMIGVYENLFGRLTEIANLGFKTTEDRYTDAIAREYGDFLLYTPWYRFPYFQKLAGLWTTYGWSSVTVRGLERRAIFTLAYTAKGLYGKIITAVTESSYTPAGLTTMFTVKNISPHKLATLPGVTILETSFADGVVKAEAPRYRAFSGVAQQIMARGGIFLDIQGNTRIMATVLADPENACLQTKQREPAFAMPILTNPATARLAFVVPVAGLHLLFRDLAECGAELEHIYDY